MSTRAGPSTLPPLLTDVFLQLCRGRSPMQAGTAKNFTGAWKTKPRRFAGTNQRYRWTFQP